MNINELNDYFLNILNLLEEHKWIYDFQVIDIFNNDILEDKFPVEVFIILEISKQGNKFRRFLFKVEKFF
jgi:hypothetical protein